MGRVTTLELAFTSGEASLSVRRFSVREALSSLFTLSVWARSPDPSLDLGSLVGGGAAFRAEGRLWTGVLTHAELLRTEPAGLSTYVVEIAPSLWLLTQRRGHRIFQHLSVPDILDRLLAEWQIEPRWELDRAAYPRLAYKVQYGENDHDFAARLLEEAGIAYAFVPDEQASRLVFSDRFEQAEARAGGTLPAVERAGLSAPREHVTAVRLAHEVRPGAVTLRDHDFRRPAFTLTGEATPAADPEGRYEQYDYRPGGFLVEVDQPGDTPVADDRGVARHEQDHGRLLAQRALEAERGGAHVVTFATTALDLCPSTVFSMASHPHPDLPEARRLLVTQLSIEGTWDGVWQVSGRAAFADTPFRPPRRRLRPRAHGVQLATVVGPPSEEIHTDEFGRVRVLFPWDREGRGDDTSSCWIRVGQPMSGAGFGFVNLPRVGQEVLVGFAEGDPEQPFVVGRVFNAAVPVPYKLPELAATSGWRSSSSPGGGGANEIKLDDTKGKEGLDLQAERDLRRLVKNDDTHTVRGNVVKHVTANETDSTDGARAAVTQGKRGEQTRGDNTTLLAATSARLVRGDAAGVVGGGLARLVGGDLHDRVSGDRRERDAGGAHASVRGERREHTGGDRSLIVGGDLHEKVGGSAAIAAQGALRIAGDGFVGEAPDVTLSGSGGFVRLDALGVTISGTLVNINTGGSPRGGPRAEPASPADAKAPTIDATLPDATPADSSSSGASGGRSSGQDPGAPGSPTAPTISRPGSADATPSSHGMAVQQEKPMSCAIATARMIIRSRTGEDIPEGQLRDESHAGGSPPGYDELNGTYCSGVNALLAAHGVNGGGIWSKASVGNMESALASGRPAALLLRDVNHFVVLDGIETQPDGTQALLIRDPALPAATGKRSIAIGGDEWNRRVASPDGAGRVLNIPG